MTGLCCLNRNAGKLRPTNLMGLNLSNRQIAHELSINRPPAKVGH